MKEQDANVSSADGVMRPPRGATNAVTLMRLNNGQTEWQHAERKSKLVLLVVLMIIALTSVAIEDTRAQWQEQRSKRQKVLGEGRPSLGAHALALGLDIDLQGLERLIMNGHGTTQSGHVGIRSCRLIMSFHFKGCPCEFNKLNGNGDLHMHRRQCTYACQAQSVYVWPMCMCPTRASTATQKVTDKE